MSTVFVTGGAGLTGANVCGPTLYAIAEAAANQDRLPRTADNPNRDQLGYDPMSLDEGFGLLIPWRRELGRL